MELSFTYVLSQIFIILNYIFLIITYQLKDRNKILLFNMASLISAGISYIFLSAYTGLAMVVVAIIRNIIFLLDERVNGKHNKIENKDLIILIILYLISIILAIFTYNGFFSLMSVFATMLYTYSVWQKSTKTYKWLGPFTSLIWIIYNIHIKSIFGIILEIILMISAIVGLVREYQKEMDVAKYVRSKK